MAMHQPAENFKPGNDAHYPYTLEDYYNLPDDRRVELIDGVFYDMAAPTSIHQYLCVEILFQIQQFIKKKKGSCVPFVSPIAVQLNEDDYTMVEPDLLIVCDPKKLRRSASMARRTLSAKFFPRRIYTKTACASR